MFIDSHCHLNLLAQEIDELNSIIEQAKENGVDHIVCIAIDKTGCDEVRAIAEHYPNVTASAGIHPNVDPTPENTVTMEQLITLAGHQKIIAIGETGLDYFRSQGDLEWQRERFKIHIAAAKQVNKPLIVHTREAREDTMAILEQENADQVGGIIHCFTENWQTAQRALDIGFYISLSGIVTFRNATDLQEVAKKLPLERILIETDAPYLAPVPHRGKTNKPAYVKHVAEFLAELRGDSVDNIAKATSDNFHRLFPSLGY